MLIHLLLSPVVTHNAAFVGDETGCNTEYRFAVGLQLPDGPKNVDPALIFVVKSTVLPMRSFVTGAVLSTSAMTL